MLESSDGPPDPRFSALLIAARGGAGACAADLLSLFRPYLKQLAHRALDADVRPKEGSSDVVQKTMIEGQRDFVQCDANDPASIRLWLRRILLNNLHDVHRRYTGTQRRDVGRERSLHDLDSQQVLRQLAVSSSESPSQLFSKAEQAELVGRALTSLKAEYREAIVLRYEDGLTYAEIGNLVGKSPGAAEQLVKRALYKLGLRIRKIASRDDFL